MAFTSDDVETWLIESGAVGSLDAGVLDRVIDAVMTHAARFYDLADIDAGTDAERDQALIMECGRLYQRKHTQNGYAGAGDLGPVRVLSFDNDVRALLAGRLITSGLFGPSGTTEAAT